MELPFLFLRWPVYASSFCFFPPATLSRWQGQARLSAPGAMGRITNAEALVAPAPRGSRDAAGREKRDAVMPYLGIKKELGKNARFWEVSSGEKI